MGTQAFDIPGEQDAPETTPPYEELNDDLQAAVTILQKKREESRNSNTDYERLKLLNQRQRAHEQEARIRAIDVMDDYTFEETNDFLNFD